jgi:phage tail-like protein
VLSVDANGTRFWLLRGEDWLVPTDASVDARIVRLASRRAAPLGETPAAAEALLAIVPDAMDGYGARLRWDPASRRVLAEGPVSGEIVVDAPPGAGDVTDLAVDGDGGVAIAIGGAVRLVDLGGRWAPALVSAAGLEAWRLAARDGDVWALDRGGRVARLVGRPLPGVPPRRGPTVFRPEPEDADPPRVEPAIAIAGDPVAIAIDAEGRPLVVSWVAGGAELHRVEPPDAGGARVVRRGRLPELERPYSIAVLADGRIALRGAGTREALTLELREDGDTGLDVLALGDFHPFADAIPGPFLHSPALPPLYPTPRGPRGLHRVWLPQRARRAHLDARRPIDSGEAGFVWHRAFLEASLPPRTGAVLWLCASDEPSVAASDEWHPHRFGDVGALAPGAPEAVWWPEASELPFHEGLLGCPLVPLRSGSFGVLLQRRGRRTSTLRGRYLHVRLEVLGDGLATPEIAALRVWGPRFSYAKRYLPELYHESLFAPDADAPSATVTPADFHERFLANFEGVLTSIEDRIAAAPVLTSPAATPREALGWLASWVGLALDPIVPPDAQRRIVEHAPILARKRGTLAGLELAIDLATGGMLRRGAVVVVEDFRLRRVLGTILESDLTEPDPLGLAPSDPIGSFLGDTLVLGDETRREFLALFATDVPEAAREEEAIDAFFASLAHRVTVLVQRDAPDAGIPGLAGLVRRIVEREAPAHCETRVVVASHPLVIGLRSLVGVDTVLAPEPPPASVRLDRTRLGIGDLLRRVPGADPRIEGTEADRGDGP